MLLLDVITVLDDFERAIKSSEESKDFDAFHSGVVMIEKQFVNMLENKWALSRFDSVGDDFDPNRHQAITAEESDEYESPRVVEDYQRGYLLQDRVLRPAKVKVVKPKAGMEAEVSTETEANNLRSDENG
jgi:molecular chaperone GrpE